MIEKIEVERFEEGEEEIETVVPLKRSREKQTANRTPKKSKKDKAPKVADDEYVGKDDDVQILSGEIDPEKTASEKIAVDDYEL
ncbi:hypothetical protein M5689_012734 [Euphorbia peplus]|nr:hypothetical protein M5689_012734 [Euphorbia peplus]